ncbi:MAG: DUF3333 domain-containing protein, partial [Sphingomicrobium sp.]
MSSAVHDQAISRWSAPAMQKRVRGRYAAERRFRLLGLSAVAISVGFLAFLLLTMASKGLGGFIHYEGRLPIDFATTDLFLEPSALRGPGAQQAVAGADLEGTIVKAATAAYGPVGAEMFGDGAITSLTRQIVADPDLLRGTPTLWLPLASSLDIAAKHDGEAAAERTVAMLKGRDALRGTFNFNFLTASDSTDPSSVGVWGALKGSFLTILVTMGLAFPVGVFAAVYLEEFAPKNRWTDAIEVSINNLAAVPSIIFGLLGLAVFL